MLKDGFKIPKNYLDLDNKNKVIKFDAKSFYENEKDNMNNDYTYDEYLGNMVIFGSNVSKDDNDIITVKLKKDIT